MSTVYTIGVDMIMSGNAPAELAKIATLMDVIQTKITETSGKLSMLGKIGLGAIGAGVGLGIIHELEVIGKHGDKLLDQENKLLNTGVARYDIAKLTARAYEDIIKEVPTATASEALRVANEMKMITASMEVGSHEMTENIKLGLKLEALTKSLGKNGDKESYGLFSILEKHADAMSEERSKKMSDDIYKIIASSGGRVTASQIAQVASTSAVAFRNLKQDVFSTWFGTAMQEMPGNIAGALNQFYSFMQGGQQVFNTTVRELNRIGAIDPTKVLGNSGKNPPGLPLPTAPGKSKLLPGAITVPGIDPNGGMDPMEAFHGPGGFIDRWIKVGDFTRENYEKDLAAGGKGPTANKIMQNIYQAFTNEGQRRMATFFALDLPRIMRETPLIANASGINTAYKSIGETPKVLREQEHASKEAALEALGAPVDKVMMELTKPFIKFWHVIGEFANKNPGSIEAIAKVLTTLGVGLAVLGTAVIGVALAPLVAALGTTGWLITGLTGLAAAMAALSPHLKPFLDWATGTGDYKKRKDGSMVGVGGELNSADIFKQQSTVNWYDSKVTLQAKARAEADKAARATIMDMAKLPNTSDSFGKNPFNSAMKDVGQKLNVGTKQIPPQVNVAPFTQTLAQMITTALQSAAAQVTPPTFNFGGAFGAGGGAGDVKKMNFTPPSGGGGKVTPINVNTHIDGKVVARWTVDTRRSSVEELKLDE